MFGKVVEVFGILAQKSHYYDLALSKLNRLFFESKNAERKAVRGGLACVVPEGSLRVPHRLYQGYSCDI